MNKFNWTFLADNGKQHHVGLMHGANSGHLLVYCNTKIILIDFQVLKSSTYSFFIEEELCELTIERKDNRFFYGFEINQKADTPYNRIRKEQEKKHLWQSIAALTALVLTMALLIFSITYFQNTKNNRNLTELLGRVGQNTTARILMVPKGETQSVSYFFIVNGNTYSTPTKMETAKAGQPFLLQNGMPLEVGDEFLVRYSPDNPRLNKIDFQQPSPETLERYRNRAVEKYLEYAPDQTREYSQCLVEAAYDLHGIKGYADIYFLNVNPKDNPNHNKNSFLRLTRDLPFQKLIKNKCR